MAASKVRYHNAKYSRLDYWIRVGPQKAVEKGKYHEVEAANEVVAVVMDVPNEH